MRKVDNVEYEQAGQAVFNARFTLIADREDLLAHLLGAEIEDWLEQVCGPATTVQQPPGDDIPF